MQGVRAPIWRMVDGNDSVEAHERDFRKVRSPSNYWSSFQSGYRFYRQNWLDIWMREGIKPWMLGCNIWAGKPPGSEGQTK